MTDDKKDEEIIKLKKKIEELENKPKNKFKKIYFFSVSTIILLLMILLLFLNNNKTWGADYPHIPNCRAPVEGYFDETTGIGKIKYTRCVFNPDNLKNDVGDPKDEYLWLTIKFSNLTQEKFNSLRNLEFTFFDPDNVINQVDGKFYEYNGAWITNQEINGVNYESFKALKF